MEKRFSKIEINRVISALELIKNRLNLLERWNTTYLHNRLQKLQGDFYQLNKKSPPSTEVRISFDVFFSHVMRFRSAWQKTVWMFRRN